MTKTYVGMKPCTCCDRTPLSVCQNEAIQNNWELLVKISAPLRGIKMKTYADQCLERAENYADQCLERAEKATEGPWIKNVWAGPLEGASGVFAAILAHGPVHKFKYCNLAPMHDAEFISHARTDVPELARRLKQACETIRACGGHWAQWSELLKELEAPLKDES